MIQTGCSLLRSQNEHCKKIFPSIAPIQWNYNSRLVSTIIDHKGWSQSVFSNPLLKMEINGSDTYNSVRGFYAIFLDFYLKFNLWCSVPYCLKWIPFLIFNGHTHTHTPCGDFDMKSQSVCRSKRMKINNVSDKKNYHKILFCEITDVVKVKITQIFSDINQLDIIVLLEWYEFLKTFPEELWHGLKDNILILHCSDVSRQLFTLMNSFVEIVLVISSLK